MPAVDVATSHIKVSVGGATLTNEVADMLMSVEVESTYDRPDEATLKFNIAAGADPPSALDVGKALKITTKAERQGAADATLFEGEITSVETAFELEFTTFVVIGHDKLHRLFRGDKNKTFKDIKFSDIASQAASAHGLTATVDSTSAVLPTLWQHNETDGDFLMRLAHQVDHFIWADGSKLLFKKVGSGQAAPIELEMGKNLITFSTRATAKTLVKEVEVRGWDPKE